MNVELFPSFGTGQLANTAGDSTIYTPQSGKRIRLRWLNAGTPSTNTADVVLAMRFGSDPPFYTIPLPAPGAFSHRMVRIGSVGDPLIANLNGAQSVYINVDVEEIA